MNTKMGDRLCAQVVVLLLLTSSCTHFTPPPDYSYDDPDSLLRYASTLAPRAVFDELPTKTWGDLRPWRIEYNDAIAQHQPEYAAVTFIDHATLTTNSDGYIEYDILDVDVSRKGRFQFMTVRQVLMPGNDEADAIKKNLAAFDQFKTPLFYVDIASRSIVDSSTNSDIRTTADLQLTEITYEYFRRPQKAEVTFTVKGSKKKYGDSGYTWQSKSVMMNAEGRILETRPPNKAVEGTAHPQTGSPSPHR